MANPDGEGRFYRVSDGEQIPERILKETLEELDRIHEDLDKFSRSKEKHGTKVPRSVGHYFEVLLCTGKYFLCEKFLPHNLCARRRNSRNG